jgi:4-alpha-glucanotransferase
MKVRSSGILLHITSLPSPYGIGDLGSSAYAFVDFLKRTGQCIWQLLPLNPTNMAHANSPYSSNSAYAGNPLLINPDLLVRDGYLRKKDLKTDDVFREDRVDFHQVTNYKHRILNAAYDLFMSKNRKPVEYEQFYKEEAYWLDDFALFVALKQKFNGAVWGDWPWEVRDRQEHTIEVLRRELQPEIIRQKFYQFLFFKQWNTFKAYTNDKNITLFGDIPIYVNYDSADVWTNPEIFKLNGQKKPIAVAGVPPDLFSSTGQLWGNPVFNWDRLRATEFHWWLQRIRHNLKQFNLLRIDHFRGLVAYWEVGAHEQTAVNGRWVDVPVTEFLNTVIKSFPSLPLVAEDLGVITPDVRETMQRYAIPGMKVLLFAFFEGMERGPYIPHNHIKDCIVYTGTHDNNTVRGWFEHEASEADRKRIFNYIGRTVTQDEISWEFIRMAMMSVANIAIIPMQDILSLGSEARMNRPATSDGNWEWQLREDQITDEVESRLKEATYLYGRS